MLTTKLFLDGGDPKETREIVAALGFLDGQTTNPTLIAKNPDAQKCLVGEEKCTREDLLGLYKDVVRELSSLIPTGSVSIEVYADRNTTAEEMLKQAREMFTWIPNAHIKFPTTHVGLAAAEQFISEGGRVNLTLVFSQEQAAAVHAATRGAKKGDVFVSPFIGRLDDGGENGMDLIKNIRKMYDEVGSHVEVLAASIRSMEHLLASFEYKSDIITAPAKILKEWAACMRQTRTARRSLTPTTNLKPIAYQKLDLSRNWREFDISHPLTEKGVERFASDWNALIG